MTSSDRTDHVIDQGRALVWAIEALGAIDSPDPFECILAELFQEAYERCLHSIVANTPAWMGEEILSTREDIQIEHPPAWLEAIEGPGVALRPLDRGNGRTRPTLTSPVESRRRHAGETAKRRREDPSTPAL
jgi:hypothetical protein